MTAPTSPIPVYARPVSPGRMLEGPPERFTPRAVHSNIYGRMWVVFDRQWGTSSSPLMAEGSAIMAARSLSRGAVA